MIGDLVHDLYCELGFEHDFAEQTPTVFGGTNRVVLDLRHGLVADHNYCTPEFLQAFNAWKQGAAQ